MDFLLEPIIDIDTDTDQFITPATKACCSDGSGCSSGVASNVNLAEV
jgi:hypothetical protein